MNTTPITIAGNAADIPELRFTPAGKATARLRVAVTSRYQDSTGAWTDGATSWHTVILWGTAAENAVESIAKGDRVIVHGRLEQRDYQTEAGDRRTTWEITAEEIGVSLRYATAKPVKITRGVSAA